MQNKQFAGFYPKEFKDLSLSEQLDVLRGNICLDKQKLHSILKTFDTDVDKQQLNDKFAGAVLLSGPARSGKSLLTHKLAHTALRYFLPMRPSDRVHDILCYMLPEYSRFVYGEFKLFHEARALMILVGQALDEYKPRFADISMLAYTSKRISVPKNTVLVIDNVSNPYSRYIYQSYFKHVVVVQLSSSMDEPYKIVELDGAGCWKNDSRVPITPLNDYFETALCYSDDMYVEVLNTVRDSIPLSPVGKFR